MRETFQDAGSLKKSAVVKLEIDSGIVAMI